MQLQFCILATLLAALVSITEAQVHEGMGGNNHRRWLSRKWTNRDNNTTALESRGQLERRFDNARFSFYDAGLSACGGTYTNSDYIVALNAAQYAGGALCYQTITITANGKTTTAKIVDRCVGCPWGGLDFSRGLFDFFASEGAGIIYGTWTLGQAMAPPSTSQTPKWTSTSVWSNTWTSTWSASSTTSSVSSTTTGTPTTNNTAAVSTTSSSDYVSETGISTSSGGGVAAGEIEDLFLVFVQMGRLMLL